MSQSDCFFFFARAIAQEKKEIERLPSTTNKPSHNFLTLYKEYLVLYTRVIIRLF